MKVNVRDILDGLGFLARLILGRKKMRKIQSILDDLDEAMVKLDRFKALRDKVEDYTLTKVGRPLTLTRVEAENLNELLQAIDKLGDKLEDVFNKRR